MKIIISILIFFSLFLSIMMAFFTSYSHPNLFPIGFSPNYVFDAVFNSQLFRKSFASSILLGCACGVISSVLGFLMGKGINEMSSKKSGVLMGIISLPLFFPSTCMFIGIHMMMLRLSLANSFFGVLICHVILALPYSTNIAVSFFSGIPKEFETISKILGGNYKETFKRIILPLISGGLTLSFSMSFLISISEYFATYLIGGGSVVTLSGIMYPYISNFDLQNTAILSSVFLLINISVFSISNKFAKKYNYLF